MNHWTSEYVGKKWTETEDCYFWFRKIQAERFGRQVPVLPICHESKSKWLSSTARIMNGEIPGQIGWIHTERPVEGDAIFLTQGSMAHHIGILVFVGATKYVLHCLENAGVLLSTFQNIRINGWKINGYWTPKS